MIDARLAKLRAGWHTLGQRYKVWAETETARRLLDVGVSLGVGVLAGGLFVFSGTLSSTWQQLVLLIPIALMFVLLINNLEKLILASVIVGVPLNLDVSLIISPYSGNDENIAKGNRVIVALTELRISFVIAMVILGYALWLISRNQPGYKSAKFYPKSSIPVLAFLFFSLISLYQSQDLQLSFFRIVQLIELCVIYFYVSNHIRTLEDFQFFVTIFMWSMVIESGIMIWQWATQSNFSFAGISTELRTAPLRIGGTFEGVNVAGGILSAYLLIVWAMLWVFPKRSQKVFAMVCFVLGFACLISTGSRSSWTGTVIALFLFVLVGLWRGWVKPELLVILVAAFLVLGAAFYQPVYQRLTADDRGSAESRSVMARLAWNVIRKHLWWGVGANNYALVAPDYYTPNVGYIGYIINSSVHNAYLLAWAETGLFGLLSYIALLVSPLIQVWRYVQTNDKLRALIALGVGGGIISMMFQMLAEPFSPRPSTLFIWLLVSLVTCLDNLPMSASKDASVSIVPVAK